MSYIYAKDTCTDEELKRLACCLLNIEDFMGAVNWGAAASQFEPGTQPTQFKALVSHSVSKIAEAQIQGDSWGMRVSGTAVHGPTNGGKHGERTSNGFGTAEDSAVGLDPKCEAMRASRMPRIDGSEKGRDGLGDRELREWMVRCRRVAESFAAAGISAPADIIFMDDEREDRIARMKAAAMGLDSVAPGTRVEGTARTKRKSSGVVEQEGMASAKRFRGLQATVEHVEDDAEVA